MATFTIPFAYVPWVRPGTAPVLYVYYSVGFTASDGNVVLAGNPSKLTTYKKIATTLEANADGQQIVTIPQFTIQSTEDGKDDQSSRVSFYFYTDKGVVIGPFAPYVDLRVPASLASASGCAPLGTCGTFADLLNYNRISPGLPPDEYYTKKQTDQKLLGVVPSQTVTHGGPLTANAMILGAGAGDVKASSIVSETP